MVKKFDKTKTAAKPKAKAASKVKVTSKVKAKVLAKANVKAKPKPVEARPEIYAYVAGPELKGLRLDKAMVALTAQRSFSRSQIAHMLDNGGILVDGERAVARQRLKGGEAISVTMPEVRTHELKPANIPLDVIYEDKDLLVINKAAGLVTHPGAGHFDDTLANALLAYCKGSLKPIHGSLRPGIVHRLDKDTSGCLVAAKTERAYIALQSMVHNREMTRLYRALVWGDLREDTGTIDAPLGRGPDRKRMALRMEGGKAAVTHFSVMTRFKNACELECKLETGRTHQIRAHLLGIGHSVVGDPDYGRTPGHLAPTLGRAISTVLPRQALHAWKLQFKHPITGKAVKAEAPLPADYMAARKLLKDAA